MTLEVLGLLEAAVTNGALAKHHDGIRRNKSTSQREAHETILRADQKLGKEPRKRGPDGEGELAQERWISQPGLSRSLHNGGLLSVSSSSFLLLLIGSCSVYCFSTEDVLFPLSNDSPRGNISP